MDQLTHSPALPSPKTPSPLSSNPSWFCPQHRMVWFPSQPDPPPQHHPRSALTPGLGPTPTSCTSTLTPPLPSPAPYSPAPAHSCLDTGLASSQGSLAARAQAPSETARGTSHSASSQVKSCPAGQLLFSPHGLLCSDGRGEARTSRSKIGGS